MAITAQCNCMNRDPTAKAITWLRRSATAFDHPVLLSWPAPAVTPSRKETHQLQFDGEIHKHNTIDSLSSNYSPRQVCPIIKVRTIEKKALINCSNASSR